MKIDIEKMKTRLEEEKLSLENTLKKHGHRVDGNWMGSSDDITTLQSDQNEVADQVEELVTNVPLVEELERRYENILWALKKIEDGTYGKCECGDKISPERLEINPAAKTCIKHSKGSC